jgi:hypothetical protein
MTSRGSFHAGRHATKKYQSTRLKKGSQTDTRCVTQTYTLPEALGRKARAFRPGMQSPTAQRAVLLPICVDRFGLPKDGSGSIPELSLLSDRRQHRRPDGSLGTYAEASVIGLPGMCIPPNRFRALESRSFRVGRKSTSLIAKVAGHNIFLRIDRGHPEF